MIRCKLKEIMQEKGTYIRKLHVDSGIRLETLSKLTNNTWGAATPKVMNNLCTTLGVTPGELFEYVPDREEIEWQ